MVRVIGYARVSADDPNVSLQFDALKQVGGPDRHTPVIGRTPLRGAWPTRRSCPRTRSPGWQLRHGFDQRVHLHVVELLFEFGELAVIVRIWRT